LRQDFAGAYQQHVLDVYGFIAYRVRSRADAEDLTQATFERALRAWSRYDESRASVRTWLLAIARNVLADHHRRGPASVEQPVDALVVGRDEAFLPPEPSLGLDPRLADALAQLGQREREIIALRVGGDLSGPEIAALLGLSLANVQQILSRSLRRLRAAIEELDDAALPYGASGPPPAMPSAAMASSAAPEST
jgi:RNA polymerase sigma-70 factor (ECF subfamily)